MNKNLSVTDLFLATLALLLISVSFWQTWIGLQQIFGGASLVIAFVLSLLMLFLCWMIRNAKVQGKPVGGLLGIYTFIALFCFIANFNALYTRFMRTDIYTTELRNINELYNLLETNVEANLNYSVSDVKMRQAVRSEVDLLKIQIKDPKNAGIGVKAKQIIVRIEKLLGKKITPLTPISETPDGYEDLANRMEEQIIKMAYNLSAEETALVNDIRQAVTKWNKEIQNTLVLDKKEVDEVAQKRIDEALAEYNKLGNRALSVLAGTEFSFTPATSETQDVGKIGYAFRHAIDNFGMYQFVVLAGCILLDFVIVIIILLVVNPDDKNNRHTNGNGSVFAHKRQGKTLIPHN